jgi:hypothetical protein
VIVLINNSNLSADVVRGSINISLRPNGERSASVSFYLVYPDIRDGDELEIFDGSQTVANKLFGGIINSYSAQMITPITDQYPVYQIDVSSDGYGILPQRRIVNYTGTNKNATDIVRDVFEILSTETVFEGYFRPGAAISTYTAKYKTIAEVLDDMANVSGYAWYIDNSRNLFFDFHSAGESAPFELVQGGSFRDFHELSWSGSLDNYANKVFVVGANNIVAIRENTAEIAQRATEADGQGTGVYGSVIEDSNITSLAVANNVGDQHLLKTAVSPGQLSFSTYTKGFKPGQKLKVQLAQITDMNNDPFVTPSVPYIWYYLIDEVSIERENDKVTKYTISATRRYNSSFNTKTSDGFKEYFKNLVKK